MIDQKSLIALNEFVSGNATLSFLAVFCAHWLPYLLVAAALAIECAPFFRGEGRRRLQDSARYLFELLSTVLAAGLLAELWKLTYPSARPFFDLSFTPLVLVDDPLGAFPSSHASVFAALGMTMYLRNKKTGAWFLAGALVVGLARVAVGIHYPIDILAGFLFGGALALLFHGLFANPKK